MDVKSNEVAESKPKSVVDHLNDLLANYHLHYQKTRGCHWNVKGANFFTLHEKFEELFTAALLTIDELAERILTLGKPPYSTFKDYLKVSTIQEMETFGMSDSNMVRAVVEDMEKMIEVERELLVITAEAGDDGSNDMINRFMQFKEKNIRMLKSFLYE
jgi:starvation-inducible DNA-binding protein